MNIKFEDPTEAIVALVSAVVAVDNVGSVDERNFLFEQVKSLDLFKNYDQAEFSKLLSEATGKIYATLPMDGASIAKQGIENLTQAAKEVLSPELRETAFRLAVGLARADKPTAEEMALLEQFQHGLEIDNEVAQAILKN